MSCFKSHSTYTHWLFSTGLNYALVACCNIWEISIIKSHHYLILLLHHIETIPADLSLFNRESQINVLTFHQHPTVNNEPNKSIPFQYQLFLDIRISYTINAISTALFGIVPLYISKYSWFLIVENMSNTAWINVPLKRPQLSCYFHICLW